MIPASYDPINTASSSVASGTVVYDPVSGASTYSGQVYNGQAPSANQPTQPTVTQRGGNPMPQGTYNVGAGQLKNSQGRRGLMFAKGWLGLPFWALLALLVFVLTGISLTIYSLMRRRRREA